MLELILALGAFVVGICAGWLIGWLRVPDELAKLRAEIEAKRGSELEELKSRSAAERAVLEGELASARELGPQLETAQRDLQRSLAEREEAQRESERLSRRLEEQEQALSRAEEESGKERAQAERLAEALRESSGQLERLQEQITQAGKERKAAEAQASNASESLHRANRRIEELETERRRLTDELVRAQAAPRKAETKSAIEASVPTPAPPMAVADTCSAAPESSTAERPPVLEPAPTAAASIGPTLLDVLEMDPRLNPGQRETIRVVYSRFAPKVGRCAPEALNMDLSVLDALERDPNLNRGQRETIRTMYTQFARKPKTALS